MGEREGERGEEGDGERERETNTTVKPPGHFSSIKSNDVSSRC